jgi:SAM-dependent methyltransferase
MKKIISWLLNFFPRKYLISLSYPMMKVISLFYRGNKVECPVCEKSYSTFLPYGYHNVRASVLCPGCFSLERHRLIWLFLKNKTRFFEKELDLLHIAPEQCFYKKFKKLKNLRYITADMDSPLADVKLDVQNMPFDDNRFDMVICNHVLEHVKDDLLAMREILRVLKPGGIAILLVPFLLDMPVTYEDPSITDPDERLKHFMQKDHYRIYGSDC